MLNLLLISLLLPMLPSLVQTPYTKSYAFLIPFGTITGPCCILHHATAVFALVTWLINHHHFPFLPEKET